MKKLLAVVPILLLAASVSHAQAPSDTGTSVLTVNVGAEAAIVVGTTPAFTSSGIFGDYKATTPLTYFVRTITGGNISLQVTSDFAAGGPSVAHPAAGDSLTYTPTVSSPGTTAGVQTALITGTPVATFGTAVQSAKGGNPASLAWDLTNDPAYAAGSYSATVTVTISAT